MMTANILLFIVCATIISVLDAVWEIGSGTLPRPDWGIAAGAYNDSIFIVGGDSEGAQATEYQMNTNTFVDLGPNYLTDEIRGEGQFWAHHREILYMIHEPKSPTDPSVFGVFNMKSKQYFSHWMNVSCSAQITYGCLAVSDPYLFVVGGFLKIYSDTMFALSLTTHEWMNNTPSMIRARAYHACYHHRDLLCAFGGYDKQAMADSECLNTSDILQNTWRAVPPLTEAVYRDRVTAAFHYFYILGGYSTGSDHYKDTMHIYDMDANTMVLSDDHMLYGITQQAVITVHNIIYVFGGGGNAYLDTWMKYDLTTLDPTEDTTAAPSSTTSTNPPTGNPSIHPIMPSTQPSMMPSAQPSRMPSAQPSRMPSETTSVSTDHPSAKPSVHPSGNPSGNPSRIPTETSMVTGTPTENATGSPAITKEPSVSRRDATDATTLVTKTMTTDDMGSGVVTETDGNAMIVSVCALGVIVGVCIGALYIYCKRMQRSKCDVDIATVNQNSQPTNTIGDTQLAIANTEFEPATTMEQTGVYNVKAIMQGSVKMTKGREDNSGKEAMKDTAKPEHVGETSMSHNHSGERHGTIDVEYEDEDSDSSSNESMYEPQDKPVSTGDTLR